ncbi:hypothetical protein [Nostoc sp. ChiVER01]|uniref:hypothetical protein n=1 Tax=Nostoc sp. ChiVER01 TaxID=3075382 RepID=UPI002AD33EEB|nr:hypothetical protein [Nostoc sp. ChiVER01]MDZ8227745.1 hypothetical protein [Nostoc sp. ChiVER01]
MIVQSLLGLAIAAKSSVTPPISGKNTYKSDRVTNLRNILPVSSRMSANHIAI